MSYELLYQRFLVKDGDKLTPYFIHGSNNCFEVSGKRERDVSNLFNWFKDYKDMPQNDLNKFLGILFDKISNDDSGFLKGIPKTKQGFISGFYKKTIDKTDLMKNGELMELKLKRMFKTERPKPKSTYEINQELKDQEFIEFKQEDIPKIKDRILLVYDRFKNLLTDKGKIKPLVSGKEHGFFMNRSRRRYLPLYNIKYYKMVN